MMIVGEVTTQALMNFCTELLKRIANREQPHHLRRRLARNWDALTQPKPLSALITAARRGDLDAIKHLLHLGADVNEQSPSGRTPLHEAVAWDRVEVAAYLLAHGANPHLADHKTRAACGCENSTLDTLHAIRQRYHRRRVDECPAAVAVSEQSRRWTADLEQRGIVKAAGLIKPDELAQLRQDFQTFIDHMDGKLARGEGMFKHYDEEEHWWAKEQAYVTNNAFKYSEQLIKLCCNTDLLACASLYLGRTPHIQRGVAMRYLPAKDMPNDMFGWHHDMEDKRLKMLILLTHVDVKDQHMSYVVGSHQLFHPYEMFLNNACSLEYCRKHLNDIEIFDATGQAGDVFLFDSNGAHRGCRRETAAVRDAFFVEYTADRSDIWGGDIEPKVLADLALAEHNPFDWMMAVEKKWNLPVTRTVPTWPENLPYIDRWL